MLLIDPNTCLHRVKVAVVYKVVDVRVQDGGQLLDLVLVAGVQRRDPIPRHGSVVNLLQVPVDTSDQFIILRFVGLTEGVFHAQGQPAAC